MSSLEPFKDKVAEMVNSKECRPCMFTSECNGFACDKFYKCKRIPRLQLRNNEGKIDEKI